MSWISGTSEFPHDHLPFGVFQHPSGRQRVGVAVGEKILDLAACVDAKLITSIDGDVTRATSLNPLIDLGPSTWEELRNEIIALISLEREPADDLTQPRSQTAMHLPIEVGDYVDFYSSLEHATNLGRLFRPDSEPLMPNWRHIPIGYHGRAGTAVVSGTPVRRPTGQTKSPTATSPSFGPSARLDIELELGAILYRVESSPVVVDQAADHIFGLVLVNDWSARDIQAWEYQPLGPFLGKSFATSISPWVVPMASANRFTTEAPEQSPEPLEYLRPSNRHNFDIHLQVALAPNGAAEGTTISTTNAAGLYWTFAQQIAHLTSNGASIRTGDLIATGTISGTEPESAGSLIERTNNGRDPFDVNGQTRSFLEDGDTVILEGFLGGPSGPSFGRCVGTVLPADGVVK